MGKLMLSIATHKSSWNEFWTFLRDLHTLDLSVSALCSLKGQGRQVGVREKSTTHQEHKLSYPKKAYILIFLGFFGPSNHVFSLGSFQLSNPWRNCFLATKIDKCLCMTFL